MIYNPARFSLTGLLRATREVAAQDRPSAVKAAVMRSYFFLFFLGLYGGAAKTVDAAGFKVKYCSVKSLLYLFREILLHQTYLFAAETRQPFIIDCGANIGMASLYFKSLYPLAEVLAFEPDPDACACFAENMKLNLLSGVRVENAALMGAPGEAELHTCISGPGDLLASVLKERAAGPVRKVRAVRLSDYITKPVDLLKIDIEGAETEVMAELAASGKLGLVKKIVMEYHHHIDANSDSLSGMLAQLETAGFGYQLGGDLPRPFAGGRFQDILIYAYNKKAAWA